MAIVRKKSYPRASVKKLIRGHSGKSVGRNVDALVYIDYVLFIQELMRNAMRKARERGDKRAAAKDIRKVTIRTLRAFQG